MKRSDIVDNILPSVTLAPSAHNTQPWLFSVQDNRIDVYADQSRRLQVSDPTDRQLYVSLGCTITNARVAAAHQGHRLDVQYFPEGEGLEAVAARLTLIPDGSVSPASDLFQAISTRRSDRALYDSQPLTEEEKSKIPALSRSGTAVVSEQQQLNALAAVIGQGSFETLSRKDFREELSHWVRSNWTRKPDGMPGYAMGIPAPITPLLPWAVKILPIHKQEQTNTAKQARSASLMVIITSPQDNPRHWMQSGELFEQIWLEAEAAGLAAAPLAAAVEAGEPFRRRTQSIIQSQYLPQAALRIGHSPRKNLKASPRRSVSDCLKPAA